MRGSTADYVSQLLGRSIVHEELKGDFMKARQITEAAVRHLQLGEDHTGLADAMLALGLVRLLQGEPSAAHACFKQADEELAPVDPITRLRACIYAGLALNLQYNTFPNGGGANATEIAGRWAEFAAQVESLHERIQERVAALPAGDTDPAVHLELAFAHLLLPNIQAARATLDSTDHLSAEQVEQAAATVLSTPLQFLRRAEGFGDAPALVAYARLVAADLLRRAGMTEGALSFLHNAEAEYARDNDQAGVALCRMMQGDQLAAPFSTPLAWNFALRDGGEPGSDLAWFIETAEADRERCDVQGASAAYRAAEALFAEAGASRGLAAVRLRRGYLAHLDGDYVAAAEHAGAARDAFAACGDRLGNWLACAHHALAQIGAGRLPEDYDVARKIGAWGAGEGSFSFALGLGILFSRAGRHWLTRAGDYERALAAYRLAQALHEALGTATNLAQSLADQAGVHRAVGDTAAALTLYAAAFERYADRAGRNPADAETFRPRMILLTAEIYFLRVLAVDTDGMTDAVATLQAQLADVAGEAADPGAAMDGLKTELDRILAEPRGEGPQAGSVRKPNLARWAVIQHGRSVAEQAAIHVPLYQALRARKAGGRHAKRLFETALEAAKRAGEDQRDQLEAEVLLQWRKYDEAVGAFHRYLAQGGANAGWAGTAAGLLAQSGGAAGRLEEEIQERRTDELAAIFFARAQAFAKAKEHLARLEQLKGAEWWAGSAEPWEWLALYGDVHAGLDDLTEALASYERGIEELEARRRLLSRDELKTALADGRGPQNLYSRAARTAIDLKRYAEEAGNAALSSMYAVQAFRHAEGAKARALFDLIASSAALVHSPEAEGRAARRWREAAARVTTWRGLLAQQLSRPETTAGERKYLKKQIKATEDELHHAEAELASADPEFLRRINPQAELMSADEVAQALPPDTALLQYHLSGDDLLAWAITREGLVHTHRVRVDAEALELQVLGLHRACRAQAPFADRASKIAKALLEPFRGVIEGNPRLIVVPSGAMHLLPFHMLPWDGEPLIATRTISYLPSASTLRLLGRDRVSPAPERILAVGNPARMAHRPPLGGDALPQEELRWAGAEATYVTSLFPQGKVLLGPDATKAAVRERLHAYPLVHFATHAVLSEDAPMLASLLLAEGEELTVYELLGQRLDADLAVASACDTGRGILTGGDEVLGLARGLLAAGARAAIVSLWPVDDASTSLLMGRVYRLIRGGSAPEVALQSAMNGLRDATPESIGKELNEIGRALRQSDGPDRAACTEGVPKGRRHVAPADAGKVNEYCKLEGYRHPFYWAPFVFIGW